MSVSNKLILACYTVLTTLFCFAADAAEQQTELAKEQKKKAIPIEETILGMNVSGNKELPNVLYIIPWKSSGTPLSPPAISRLVDEIYAPVDPEVFTKQVSFYYQLTAETAESAVNLNAAE